MSTDENDELTKAEEPTKSWVCKACGVKVNRQDVQWYKQGEAESWDCCVDCVLDAKASLFASVVDAMPGPVNVYMAPELRDRGPLRRLRHGPPTST